MATEVDSVGARSRRRPSGIDDAVCKENYNVNNFERILFIAERTRLVKYVSSEILRSNSGAF